MTLPPPLAIGFAVAGGVPIDAQAWVTIELDDYVERRSRGILVVTEPVEQDGQSLEMARVVRELIVSELQAMRDLPPDEAIGRAFAAANGMLFDEGMSSPTRGYDRKILVGAMAMLLDGHRCTVGHVPPGQIVLIEDGLAYAVPDLATWLPDFTLPPDAPAPPEPLGYTSWTAPILAETQLSDGDVVVVASSSLAEAMALDLADTGMQVQDLAGYHGRSPDSALDLFKGYLIADRIEDGAAIVVGFPPRPGSFGVVTMDDVRWRLRERRRRARAQVRGLLPHRVRSIASTLPARAKDVIPGNAMPEAVDGSHAAGSQGEESPTTSTSRWLGRVSRRRGADTWSEPTIVQTYGVPMTHGVQVHRSVSTDRGEPTWRSMLPRIPLAGPLVVVLLVTLVATLVFGIWSQLQEDSPPAVAYTALLSQADQNILLADDASDPVAVRQALDLAQASLDAAAGEGAPEDELRPRQSAITAQRDVVDNVIRVDNLTRIGTLPEELQGDGTSAELTPSGLFLVNGGLYQIRTDERQVIPILEPGEDAGGVEVRDLYGVALDTTGLHVTDGYTAFTLESDSSWSPVKLGEINELGRWEPGPVGAFGGNIYILQAEYRNIYQFDTEAEGVAEPRDWVLASVRPDLIRAVDMAISRNIYVLIDNNVSIDEVFVYARGDLDSRHEIPYAADTTPTAVLIGPATQLVYVAVQDESGNGAVIVFDPISGEGWQLRLPADISVGDADVAPPFEGLQDIAIDEDTGTLYLVNEDAVWTAQYQLPVDTEGTPTPQPDADTSD